MKDFLNRFFPSKKKTVSGDIIESMPITLTPVYRQRVMSETARKAYTTELLDTYWGWGSPYLAGYIKLTITNQAIQKNMINIIRCLPLLKYFVNSISRVYSVQPTRKFYLNGKEIIKMPKEKLEKPTKAGDEGQESDDGAAPFNPLLNEEKFIYDDKLYEALNNLYNDEIITSIKQAERYTNLLNTAIYKIITSEGKIKMVFLPSDTVQVQPYQSSNTQAEQIAFIQDVQNYRDNIYNFVPVVENWTEETKKIVVNGVQRNVDVPEDEVNNAAIEYEKLFGTKKCGSAFAPFVVFRDSGSPVDFWDMKDNDIVAFIKSINCSLTELKYLEKFTAFGLKYTVNIKVPNDGVMDPNGFLQLAVENSTVPGMDGNKNFEVGEFKNEGRIQEVINSIIFNLKMLFSIYNIPLDALISTNSKASAESKQMDSKELSDAINAQRDIWNNNEQNLFKVMCAVHNRDNEYQIPKGVELCVNFEEQRTVEKTADDWLVEIQNNISTALDWLSETNPDLDRDELMNLLQSNKEINDSQKEEPLNMNDFAEMDEKGNLIIPKKPDINNTQNNNDNNNDDSSDY